MKIIGIWSDKIIFLTLRLSAHFLYDILRDLGLRRWIEIWNLDFDQAYKMFGFWNHNY